MQDKQRGKAGDLPFLLEHDERHCRSPPIMNILPGMLLKAKIGEMFVDIQAIRRIVADSDNIVFFGGAGTSTESGIPDFRSAGGLYNTEIGGFSPEEMLSRDFFLRHTPLFYQFYLKHMIYKDVRPNAAHRALAELERQGKLKAVITQNIDGLHQMAGSKEVLELHGSVHRNYCMKCGKFFDLDYVLAFENSVPTCDRCEGIVKPDVVLYQEPLDHEIMRKARDYIARADVLIVAGTSLSVYPAAGLVQYYNGNNMILINQSPTPYDGAAHFVLRESIGKVMQSLI